mgnify:CR=1 FL=1
MKTMKKIASVLLTVSILLTIGSVVFATGKVDITAPGNNAFSSMGNKVLGYIQWFGYVIAVGMLLFIGIKYMMSSANEKADLKKGSINYVIGAILVATAATVVGFFQTVGSDVVGE